MVSAIPAWALFFFPVMCGIMAVAVLGSVICWCCRERENGKANIHDIILGADGLAVRRGEVALPSKR